MSPRFARRGSAAVEFALVAPILVSICIGSIDFGHYFLERSHVINAARDATRAAVTGDASGATSVAYTESSDSLSRLGFDCGGGHTCSITATVTTGTPDVLEVQLLVSYTPIVGLLPTPSQIPYTFSMAFE